MLQIKPKVLMPLISVFYQAIHSLSTRFRAYGEIKFSNRNDV
jgi:hypothetical protein